MINNKKKKKNKTICFIVIIMVLVILLCYSFNLERNNNVLENSLKTITTALNQLVLKPLENYNTYKEIDQSKSEVVQNNINKALEKEVVELKKLLDLKQAYTDYKSVNAKVLTRNKSYWFNTMTIDKGIKDGIEKNQAVVASQGLVGKISKVYKNSSEVKLITADDVSYKVSVLITSNDKDTYGVLGGYKKEDRTLKILEVDKDSDIKKGDAVVTSGYGGIFPRGIYIGNVSEVENDKYNLSKTLYVKTQIDFNSIHYVTVLGAKK